MSATLNIVTNPGILNDYENQIDFDSLAQQKAYWDSKIVRTLSNLAIKWVNDHIVKVLGNFNSMKNSSYCFIDSEINGVQKRYYYFINDIKLLSYGQIANDSLDDTIQLELEEDVFQTYMFDYTIKESFIKREHQDRFSQLDTDHYKFNIEHEDLDIGNEYEVKSAEYLGGLPDLFYFVYCKEKLGKHYYVDRIGDVENTALELSYCGAPNYYGINQNMGYYVYIICASGKPLIFTYNNTTIKEVNSAYVENIIDNPKVVKIVATRYLPEAIQKISNVDKYAVNRNTFECCRCELEGNTSKNLIFVNLIKTNQFEKTILTPSPTSISLSPLSDVSQSKEPKLLTYPYQYERINAFGKYGIIRNEDWSILSLRNFNIKPGFANDTRHVITPLKYLNSSRDFAQFHQIKADVDTQINIISDAWANYEANNSASINGGLAVKAVGAGISIIGGVASGNYVAAGAGALGFGTQIANEMLKREDIKNTPDEVTQSPCDTYNPMPDNNYLIISEKVSIKTSYLNKVFNYFLHFGYACNNFKVPNIRSRIYYNYIKTIGINLSGNINNKIINELQKIYDKGITIWHYRSSMSGNSPTYNFKFIDYSKENAEMSLSANWS